MQRFAHAPYLFLQILIYANILKAFYTQSSTYSDSVLVQNIPRCLNFDSSFCPMCFLIQMLINTRIERERETTFSQEHVIHTRTRALYTCVCDRARLSLSPLVFSLPSLSQEHVSVSLPLKNTSLSISLPLSLSLSLSLSRTLKDTWVSHTL